MFRVCTTYTTDFDSDGQCIRKRPPRYFLFLKDADQYRQHVRKEDNLHWIGIYRYILHSFRWHLDDVTYILPEWTQGKGKWYAGGYVPQ